MYDAKVLRLDQNFVIDVHIHTDCFRILTRSQQSYPINKYQQRLELYITKYLEVE